jgi:hypothetical protein
MKILRVVFHTPESATVWLQPSWLARRFGAPTLMCELERRAARKAHDEEEGPVGWRNKYTGKRLGWMKWGSLLERALEFQATEQAPEPPVARLVRRSDGR